MTGVIDNTILWVIYTPQNQVFFLAASEILYVKSCFIRKFCISPKNHQPKSYCICHTLLFHIEDLLVAKMAGSSLYIYSFCHSLESSVSQLYFFRLHSCPDLDLPNERSLVQTLRWAIFRGLCTLPKTYMASIFFDFLQFSALPNSSA